MYVNNLHVIHQEPNFESMGLCLKVCGIMVSNIQIVFIVIFRRGSFDDLPNQVNQN